MCWDGYRCSACQAMLTSCEAASTRRAQPGAGRQGCWARQASWERSSQAGAERKKAQLCWLTGGNAAHLQRIDLRIDGPGHGPQPCRGTDRCKMAGDKCMACTNLQVWLTGPQRQVGGTHYMPAAIPVQLRGVHGQPVMPHTPGLKAAR